MAWIVRDPLKNLHQNVMGMGPLRGECATLAQTLIAKQSPQHPMPLTKDWRPGQHVRRDIPLPKGTVIATFVHDHYLNRPGGSAHTAIYLGQTDAGIMVVHQCVNKKDIWGTLIPWAGSKWPQHHLGVSLNFHVNSVPKMAKREDIAELYSVVEPRLPPQILRVPLTSV